MNIKNYMLKIGQQAKKASFKTASATTIQKNKFLNNLGNRVLLNEDKIIASNKKDLIQASKDQKDEAFIDRLTLNKKNIIAMADGLFQLEKLDDPIGQINNQKTMRSGIKVSQMRVSLGVIGMIYESRPNVTIDAAGLSIKSGNAIILRGGSEAINSNTYLGELITQSLKETGLHSSSVQIIKMTDREAVTELITMSNFVDVIIPRGGKSLIKKITEDAKEEDYYTEYEGPIISIKIVNSIDEAIEHINKYSSKHTESIITKNQQNGQKFIREIDSSSVMINASTRFADGFEYGLGAEIGISTDKFHARGPVGLEGLTSLKYIVLGTGQIRK